MSSYVDNVKKNVAGQGRVSQLRDEADQVGNIYEVRHRKKTAKYWAPCPGAGDAAAHETAADSDGQTRPGRGGCPAVNVLQ